MSEKKSEKMQITKIKLNKDLTAKITYTIGGDDDTSKEVVFTRSEPVTSNFTAVFRKAVDGFVGCISLLAHDKNQITMNEIKLEYDAAGDVSKASYGVKYAFSDEKNAVINIATPMLPIYSPELSNCFSIAGYDEDTLYEVIDEAKAYINGQTRTSQMKLTLVEA